MASKREAQAEITPDSDEIACGCCLPSEFEQWGGLIGAAGECCQERYEQTVVFPSTERSGDPDASDWGKTP
jgi:hypothetical protein